MSLVNEMLRELDERHAVRPDAGIQQHLHPVSTPRRRWPLLALTLAVVVGASWLAVTKLYPTSPLGLDADRPLAVTPASAPVALAPASTPPAKAMPVTSSPRPESRTASEAAPARAAEAAPVRAPVTSSPPPASSSHAATGRAVPAVVAQSQQPKPPLQPMVRPVPSVVQPAGKSTAVEPKVSVAMPAGNEASAARVGATASPPAPAAASTAGGANKIDKQMRSTPRERANIEFRKAATLLQRGRSIEAIDGMRTALAIDPSFDNVRQTLVVLLLEQQRAPEAQASLEEGLRLNPGQAGFAMLLARLLVDRNDSAGALQVLDRHKSAGAENAAYRSLSAMLLQRAGRYGEAIDEYTAAVRINPNAGSSWLGLGMAQQAAGRRADAAASFRRARASQTLTPELQAFAEQRLRDLE